ncbi:peptidylprolyl isomerase [Deferribacter abyssi]|uniref:peptidylprolyl isomerase n=1 Tax=Deferribacter abyssi TaxID=213806 RepID=UPI003C137AEE
MIRTIIIFIIITMFVISCQKQESKEFVGKQDNKTSEERINLFKDAAIMINGIPYYKEDILNFVYFNFPETSDMDLSNDNLTSLYLDEFINFKVLLEEAVKNNIKIDDVRFEEIVKNIKNLSDESYVISLPISFEKYKKLFKENLIVKEWVNRLIEKNIVVTEDEVKSKYNEFITRYKSSVRYHVLHIVTLNYKDAKKARLELLRGKKFSEVAKKYSVGPEKDDGGDLGNIVLDDMPKVFQFIKKLKVNRISPIYKSDYGYHIFKVVGKVRKENKSYDVLKPRIYQELFTSKVDKFLNNHLKELRKNADIKIYDFNLNITNSDNSSENN